jgi:Cu+-exporting ATPase
MKKVTHNVTGITCAMCVKTIETTLNKLEGVQQATVNLAKETAKVDYDPSKISNESIVKAIEKVGYGVARSKKDVVVGVGGMTCATCVATVEKALRKLDGVYDVNVNLSSEKARIVYDPSLLGTADIQTVIEKVGYKFLRWIQCRDIYAFNGIWRVSRITYTSNPEPSSYNVFNIHPDNDLYCKAHIQRRNQSVR